MRNTVKNIIVGFSAGLLGAFSFQYFSPQPEKMSYQEPSNFSTRQVFSNTENKDLNDLNQNFVNASASSTNSVVYIKTTSEREIRSSWFDLFFDGGRMGQTVSSGSGVVYSSNGYIITNNHVIDNATKLEVVLNKKSYEATIVGTDPSTDLAVLKIEGENFPNIKLGSSQELQVGEWVLAVGNPFNLTSTVTAGIVSAKGRELNILKSSFPVESFIQTDAAINPGNSGGALVNTRGELVGINTAILSQTGSYTGYGFAVPIDIVKKVADDLIRFGVVQKAFFGAEVVDVNNEWVQDKSLKEEDGVVIRYLQKEGAAEKAGLERGDLIVAVNKNRVFTRSDFEELLSYRSPGDQIGISYKRNGKVLEKQIVLQNEEGSTGLIRKEIFNSKSLGADFEIVPKVERDLLNIESGIRVLRVRDGLFRRMGIPEGFIITGINRNAVQEPEMLVDILSKIKGKVIIEGMNKRGVKGYYTFYF
jgi:serine protease Do